MDDAVPWLVYFPWCTTRCPVKIVQDCVYLRNHTPNPPFRLNPAFRFYPTYHADKNPESVLHCAIAQTCVRSWLKDLHGPFMDLAECPL